MLILNILHLHSIIDDEMMVECQSFASFLIANTLLSLTKNAKFLLIVYSECSANPFRAKHLRRFGKSQMTWKYTYHKMLLVKTKIGQSKIHGIGIFAAEFIPKGTIIWEITSHFDLILSQAAIDIIFGPARTMILNYSYLSKRTGKFILCADDARFFNHSDNPNTIDNLDSKKEETLAARDIQADEELTGDYRTYDDDWKRKLGR